MRNVSVCQVIYLFPSSLFIYHIIMACSESQRYVLFLKERALEWDERIIAANENVAVGCSGMNESRPGSKRKVRPQPEGAVLICASSFSQSAKSSRLQPKKPNMWNHFPSVRRVHRVAEPLEKQRHLHRFPLNSLLLQVFSV